MTKHDVIKHFSYKVAFAKDWGIRWMDGLNTEALGVAMKALARAEQFEKWLNGCKDNEEFSVSYIRKKWEEEEEEDDE
jgi:hypothetical protein